MKYKIFFLLGFQMLLGGLFGQDVDFELFKNNNLERLNAFVESNRVLLPNQWKLSPIGKFTRIGDLPLQIIPHPSEKWMAIIHAGQSDHAIISVDATSGRVIDSLPINKLFYGGVFDNDGERLYVSGGNNNRIEVVETKNGKLKLVDSLQLGAAWPLKISPTGITYINGVLAIGTREDSALYMYDISQRKIVKKVHLKSAAYDVKWIKSVNEIWVSEWGNESISIFSDKDFSLKATIKVGSNPTEMAMNGSQKFLFVANANDNTVSVIDVQRKVVIEMINTGYLASSLTGSTPNSVCVYKDLLLVANADNNNLAIFQVSVNGNTKRIGFWPTGWYPTQVKVINGQIWVANAKGLSSRANPKGPNPTARKNQVGYQKGIKDQPIEYIGSLFRGQLQRFPVAVLKNKSVLRIADNACKKNFPVKTAFEDSVITKHLVFSGDFRDRPVKYVFYIIKENRTYDQVLSDIDGGNGDTSLLLFGEEITPNQHKLVREFVLLDNFYVDAEVSADGHNWSTAAIANDFTEKTWPTSYGGRGGDYVYEGQWQVAHPDKGFIWDHAKRQGISYRSYGEFVDDYKPNIRSLEQHNCNYFTSWDENVRDTTRFQQWKRDFDSLLLINQVPQLNTLRFINDHTEGVRKGRPSPFAHVADNDLAVGLFIEYLSKSKIWKESVVFILEDDAQNGPDHVDAHRSTAYLAGGYVKRNYIDHHHYTTSSMLKTMELLLGMTAMSQYDSLALSMVDCFAESADLRPFVHVPAKIDLNEKNEITNPKSTSKLMKMSEGLDLSKEDEADEFLMNAVLWKYVKGEFAELPVLRK